jgi:type I restriction enzyme M protein
VFSNPSYGVSSKTDLARMVGKDGLKDPRFLIEHGGDAAYSLVTVGLAATPTGSTPNA